LFVQTGTAEVLRNDVVAFVDNIRGIPGNKVGLHEVFYAPHDTFVAGDGLGFATEPAASIAAAQLFLQSCKG
jgi:hypothetical protein